MEKPMKTKRNVYLKMKSLGEAREILAQAFAPADRARSETVDVSDAVGRVLAEAIEARLSSPAAHLAAMDGVAVRAEDTYGVSEIRPKTLTVGQDAIYINTGHVMPPDTNAVIMIEHVQVLDDTRIRIEAPAFPWQNVRKIGEEIVATELLFPRSHVVTPYCVGALLAAGIFSVEVKARPRVLIIPTGSELVDWRAPGGPPELKPGQIYETNATVLGKLVEAGGGAFTRSDPVSDDPQQIRQAVAAAVADDYDLVLTVGGSSAGSEDYSRMVVDALGEVLVHGVTIMPGKPVIIGRVSGKPVFGIPGYPVSAIMVYEQLVQPLVSRMLGLPEPQRQTVAVELTRKVASKLGIEEFLRVKLGAVGDRIVATPLPRGAGNILSLTDADGIIRIPAHVEGVADQRPVDCELLRPLSEVRNTLVAVGSHDNTLDVLADMLKAGGGRLRLSSSHVGSMGGLMAVKRGLCHLAGTHLLDTADGTYNLSYLSRFLRDIPVRLVHLVLRDQGLIVPKGNPKGIRGVEDLARPELTFVNRQSGSGTRILLDYRLAQLGLDPAAIRGYDAEEFTHMAVAVAVLSGSADVGLGICAAARALGLDFVPVVTEQYDIVVPEAYFESEGIRRLLEIINSDEFKQRVRALGGYHLEKTGSVVL